MWLFSLEVTITLWNEIVWSTFFVGKCMQNPDDKCVIGGFVSIPGTEVQF